MRPLTRFAFLLAATGLSACIRFGDGTTTVTTVSESVSFVEAKEQAEFEHGLAEAGIPYKIEIREGNRYATWAPEYSEAASRVKASIVSEPLPMGRHIAFAPPEHQEKFKSWLREQGISYTTRLKDGREYVIWAEEHSGKVKSWRHFGPSTSEAPNPSIERTSPGKPGAASHVKR